MSHVEAYCTTGTSPPLLLKREQAAELLSISLDTFERRVQPNLKLVRLGRLRLVPIRELERFIEATVDA